MPGVIIILYVMPGIVINGDFNYKAMNCTVLISNVLFVRQELYSIEEKETKFRRHKDIINPGMSE